MISELKRRRRNTLKITLCFKLGHVPSKGDKKETGGSVSSFNRLSHSVPAAINPGIFEPFRRASAAP
jgi:hypothetical protein